MLKVKLKRAAFQRYLQTKEGRDYVLHTRARNQAKRDCRRALKDFEKQVARSAKSNPKAFFAYANSKLRTKETVADLRDSNGRKATSDTGKAGMLNTFFSSVFTKENRLRGAQRSGVPAE